MVLCREYSIKKYIVRVGGKSSSITGLRGAQDATCLSCADCQQVSFNSTITELLLYSLGSFSWLCLKKTPLKDHKNSITSSSNSLMLEKPRILPHQANLKLQSLVLFPLLITTRREKSLCFDNFSCPLEKLFRNRLRCYFST